MKGKSLNLSNTAATADNSNDNIKTIKYSTNFSSLSWKEKMHSYPTSL